MGRTRMSGVDRAVLVVLRQMKAQGSSRATVRGVSSHLRRGLRCPNDIGQPLCSVGVLGAMERVKELV